MDAIGCFHPPLGPREQPLPLFYKLNLHDVVQAFPPTANGGRPPTRTDLYGVSNNFANCSTIAPASWSASMMVTARS
jgi:hypothetical protein